MNLFNSIIVSGLLVVLLNLFINGTINKRIILSFLVFIAAFYRIYYFTYMGINMDEAMVGVNSNSLANWGVDLVLNKNPMYLYAWGSGMNILYPLIVVPFIKILGLSIFSVRLPIVILSLFSIIYFNFALEKANVRLKLRIVLNYFIFLVPYTININRLAIESMLLPILLILLIGNFFLIDADVKKDYVLLFSSFLFTLMAYSYSGYWVMLFLLIPLFYAFFIVKFKRLKIVILGLIFNSLSMFPILLFVIGNYVTHRSYVLLNITIPYLASSRSSQFVISETSHPINNIFNNLINFVTLVNTGNDGLIWFSRPGENSLVLGLFIFVIIGLIYLIGNKSTLSYLMLILAFSTLPIILLISSTLTHLNGVIIVLLTFAAFGVNSILNTTYAKLGFSIAAITGLLFFNYNYLKNRTLIRNDFAQWSNVYSSSYGKAIKFASKVSKDRECYVLSQRTGQYVYYLFYSKMSPYKFNKEKGKEIFAGGRDINSYNKIGKWHFDIKDLHTLNDNGVYIIPGNLNMQAVNLDHFKIKKFNDYTVLY
ncbi:hypothetical protein [Limosilactobacillus sp. DJ3M12]|uniref:hypothetical protein n=1 Tax=Limosilactobacillus sp. DJ3M12 TaxID=2991835 RepID=UPI00174CBE8A|nr:hypothetical protein [Limosilactobacillus sp. DJ3M12]